MGRRSKDLQEGQKELNQILQTESMKREAAEINLQGQTDEINAKYEHLTHTLAETQLQSLDISEGKAVAHDMESILGFTSQRSTNSGMPIEHHQDQVFSPISEIDFPRFDGSHPRSWILKCNVYFQLMPNLLDSQKIALAFLHFDGKAAQWLIQNYGIMQRELTWIEFLKVMSARFDDLREENIFAEFKKLRNTGSYDEYVERFEELQACMLLISQIDFPENYFVSCFVSGLSEELQSLINMFDPSTLQHTIYLGRKAVHTLEANTRKLKGFPIRLLTSAEMAVRMEKGLCYNCDEAFVSGHRCKQRIRYMLMTEEEELSHVQDMESAEESPDLSHNAISLMKVIGEVDGQKLRMVIASGSIISYISEATAKRLKCNLQEAEALMVRAANGRRMVSTRQAVDFKWKVQGHEFVYSPRVLGSEGSDLILGCDWLGSCSPIVMNYKKKTMTVTSKGEKVKLQGEATTSKGECKMISVYSL